MLERTILTQPRVVMMSAPFGGAPTVPFDTTSYQQDLKTPNIHEALKELSEPRKYYQKYFTTAEAASDMNYPKTSLGQFLRGYFHLKSADWDVNDPKPLAALNASELSKLPYYYVMPLNLTIREAVQLSMADEDPGRIAARSSRWLDDEDLTVYVNEFNRTGFQGALNWYRVVDSPMVMQDLELFSGKKIDIPAVFISGEKDWGTYQMPGALDKLSSICKNFKGVKLIPGAGHWVQQEQPEKLAEIIGQFLHGN